jgi:UDP-2-acetamido-3-amino-2,3-dideoxy-glucuronate N-acetyltransferase
MTSVAHVGYGYWGRNIARVLAELGVLAAIIDESEQAAGEAARRHGVPARTFEDVLGDAEIEGVTIASPAVLHFAQAKAALEAGKHVFVEKPLGLDVAEAEALCTLAESRGRVLMVGHLLQYHPVFAALRRIVEEGGLGPLRYAYSNRLSLGKFRHEENVLWSFAPHDLSMLLSLFREEPVQVGAQGNVSFLPGIADIVCVGMHFPSGGSAHVLASWMHPFKEQRLVVIGAEGMAVFEDSQGDWERKLAIYRHGFDLSGPAPLPRRAEPEYVHVPRSEPLRNELMHFIGCIRDGTRPLTDGQEGVRVLRLLRRAEDALAENLAAQREARRS